MKSNEYITCPVCGKRVKRNADGNIRLHYITKPLVIPDEFLPPEEQGLGYIIEASPDNKQYCPCGYMSHG